MSKMGKYCKAFPIESLQAFDGWPETYRRELANSESSDGTTQPVENDYLFIQENLTVTRGIFLDEDVVFDNVTSQWIDFCKNTLAFEIPLDVADASEEAASLS